MHSEKVDHNTGEENPLLFITPQKEVTVTKKDDRISIPIGIFDLDGVIQSGNYAIIGKRCSGKSWLIKNILNYLWKKEMVDECIIFSPVEKFNKFYNSFVPEENIYYKLNTDLIGRILTKQLEMINNKKKKNICLVLDDCFDLEVNLMKDKILNELFFNARCYKITLITTMQFSSGLKPEVRCNFDYILLTKDETLSNQKRLFDHYAGIFPKFDGFRQVFNQLTDDFGTMCLINIGNGKFEDKVKYFKAQNINEDFMIGNSFLDKDVKSEKISQTEGEIDGSSSYYSECKDFDDDSVKCHSVNEKYYKKQYIIDILSTIVESNNHATKLLEKLLSN